MGGNNPSHEALKYHNGPFNHSMRGGWRGRRECYNYMPMTLQAEQAGAEAAQAQVQMKQAQEAAAAATRMRKLLDKRMAALRAKAETAARVRDMQ